MTGQPTPHFVNNYTITGIEREPEARELYEFLRSVDVEEVGFITTDDGTAGCSPDGLVRSFCNSRRPAAILHKRM